uniref:Myotubularin phosphatase domain-containing protein n=1 Tax=Angiostrongylus cantonensis TaxID=6313 RepID=A0A0K0CVQ4_ANGCA
LAFILSINRLVDIGYPEELREGNPSTISEQARGLRRVSNLCPEHGLFCQLDPSTSFSGDNAILCYHSNRLLNYSNHFRLTEETGFKRRDKNQVIPYSTIFNDCRSAIDWIHTEVRVLCEKGL